jgi:hypothetical protein
MRNIILLSFLVFVAANVGYAEDKNKPPADYQGLIAEKPKFNKGDRWEYMRRDKTISCEFVEMKNETLVFHLQWDEWKSEGKKETEFRNSDLNLTKVIDEKGEEEQITPYKGPFSFPLWVGKKWSYSFSSSGKVDRQGAGELATTDVNVKVISHEQVKVPAGTFWAFKIEETRHNRGAKRGRAQFGTTITVWYSPEIKSNIKVEHDNDVYNRELLRYSPGSPNEVKMKK